MFDCNRNLTPLQRRTMQICAAIIGCIAVAQTLWRDYIHPGTPSMLAQSLFALLYAGLFGGMMAVLARYLRREQDEYIRQLVTYSLLCAMGLTLIMDVALGVLLTDSTWLRILPVLNLDVFAITTGICVRIQLWRNR